MERHNTSRTSKMDLRYYRFLW